MFNPEKAILSAQEDLLDRKSFCEELGKALLLYKQKESLVIGLYGKWGSGKSSVVNMTIEYLESQTSKQYSKLLVMKFNPWLFSEQNCMILNFFDQLAITIQEQKESQKLTEEINSYSQNFMPSEYAKSKNHLKQIRSIEGLRKDLNTLLLEQNYKILIVIDDIDRLTNNEIRQIFQIVKAVGDFYNIIYLLVFDKDVVIEALSEIQKGDGTEYLEKVIQVPFEIPKISKQNLQKFLLKSINIVLEDSPQEYQDHAYGNKVYHNGFKDLFNSIRDVTRYINCLTFTFNIVKRNVNPIDFMVITAFQVFYPMVYLEIRANKELFTKSLATLHSREQDKKSRQIKCNIILEKVNENERDKVKDLLFNLFPILESVYNNSEYAHQKWRKKGRICSTDNFDIFFTFSIESNEISLEETRTILISCTSDLEVLQEVLLSLNRNKKIEAFLNRLNDYIDDIPKKNIENVMIALLNTSHQFDIKEEIPYFQISDIILPIIGALLQRFEESNERFELTKRSIQKATGSVYFLIVLTDKIEEDSKNSNTYRPSLLTGEQVNHLKKIAIKKIHIQANKNKLFKEKHLEYVLHKWTLWGNEMDAVKDFVKKKTFRNEQLIAFIGGFIVNYIVFDYGSKQCNRVHLKSLSKYIDLELVKKRVYKLRKTKYNRSLIEQSIIEAFVYTVETQKEASFD